MKPILKELTKGYYSFADHLIYKSDWDSWLFRFNANLTLLGDAADYHESKRSYSMFWNYLDSHLADQFIFPDNLKQSIELEILALTDELRGIYDGLRRDG